jgi:hypothetical protein
MQHEKLTLSMTRPCSHRFSEGVGSSRHLKRKRRTHPNSVRALFFIYFSCPIVFRFIVEDAVVHLYFKYDSSPAKVNNVLVFNKIAIVPTSNISDWAKARSLHPPKKRSKLALLSPQEVQMSSKQVLRIADRELLFIVEAIRTRGAAVHLRELQALRAAQIMLSHQLAAAVLRVRGVSTDKRSSSETSAYILKHAAELGRRGGGAAPGDLKAMAEREIALRQQQRRT